MAQGTSSRSFCSSLDNSYEQNLQMKVVRGKIPKEVLQWVISKAETERERRKKSSLFYLWKGFLFLYLSCHSAILDSQCTGRESYQIMTFRYPPIFSVQEKDIHYIEGQENWRCILSISLVSKRIREICLERIFGAVGLEKDEEDRWKDEEDRSTLEAARGQSSSRQFHPHLPFGIFLWYGGLELLSLRNDANCVWV